MKFILASVLAALPLLASSHVIQSRSQRRVCGNEDVEVPRSLKDLHDQLAANESARRPSASFSASIPTYFHIVSTTANQNMVTDQMVADQLSVLNTHYAGTGFTFDLVATDRVVNAQWAAQNNEAAMQKALRKGKYSSLNIYFLTDLPQPLLGQCNYPQANPGSFTSDGCEILASSMPGGTMDKYNLGLTVVHEVGHWLGLAHPFQGSSCTADGDSVDDTPWQSTPTYDCPALGSKDSCPDAPGVDGVNNYMDYADDACMNEFTPGQIARSNSVFTAMRAGK